MHAVAKERVLLVDDEPQVLVALEDLLCDEFVVFKSESAEGALDLIDHERDIAVVITDQRMPKMTGDELLAKLGGSCDASRIMVTGFADLSSVIRAVNEGKIFAYVTKPWNAEDLQLKVHKAAEHFRLAKELRASEEKFREQTRVLNSILDSMADGVIAADRSGRFLLFNRQAEKILGTTPGALWAGDWAKRYVVHQPDHETPMPSEQSPLVLAMAGREVTETEVSVKHVDSPRATIAITAAPLRDDQGTPAGGIALLRDVTHQRRLEQQLRQSQKMEAIGRVAGGVAHDFNNLLAVIVSCAQFVLDELAGGDPRRDDLDELVAAARRAESLTKQLLAFSRQQVIQPRTLQLNEIVINIERMLGRIIGADIQLTTAPAEDVGSIVADAGQVEQILLNLTVNARDAMPEGGRLTIETANVVLDERYAAQHAGVTAGPFVMLAVTDTGTGMDAETQRSIFEPFFTTKAVGKGTGLGLATVYGIVQQSGGHIGVYSEVGRGTAFKVYFPRVDAPVETATRRRTPSAPPSATGTILLVEDDDSVRSVAARILRRRGYTVLETPGAAEARAMCAEHGSGIDLLLTDVVMPDTTGPKLAVELLASCPGMHVLYMSGYPGKAAAQDGLLDAEAAYLQKPFTPVSLTEKVREVLAQKHESSLTGG